MFFFTKVYFRKSFSDFYDETMETKGLVFFLFFYSDSSAYKWFKGTSGEGIPCYKHIVDGQFIRQTTLEVLLLNYYLG